MLPETRRRAILAHLALAGSDTIVAMSGRFHVSPMTIRRDLKLLAQAGALTLSHGGAVYGGGGVLTRRDQGDHARLAEKRAIGRYAAARFVEPGDALFLDAGTTARALIPFLRERDRLTVASNGLRALECLRRQLPGSELLSTGGSLSRDGEALAGPLAERFFDDYFARKAFVSGAAFCAEAGLSDSRAAIAAMKRAMAGAADNVIVLLDSSKLGRRAVARALPIGSVQSLVTDAGISDEDRRALLDAGVELHIAPLKLAEAGLQPTAGCARLDGNVK